MCTAITERPSWYCIEKLSWAYWSFLLLFFTKCYTGCCLLSDDIGMPSTIIETDVSSYVWQKQLIFRSFLFLQTDFFSKVIYRTSIWKKIVPESYNCNCLLGYNVSRSTLADICVKFDANWVSFWYDPVYGKFTELMKSNIWLSSGYLQFEGAGNGPVVITWIGRGHELYSGASPISLVEHCVTIRHDRRLLSFLGFVHYWPTSRWSATKKKENRFLLNGNGIISSFLRWQFYRSTL